MSFLGIDIGTSGCKSGIISDNGELLAYSYQEYNHYFPQAGWAELNVVEVWEKVKQTIKAVTRSPVKDPIKALAVISMGEAMVPVNKDREILGPSILIYDTRGETYTQKLNESLPNDYLYPKTGNTFGGFFSMTKLMWIKEKQPELYERADYFLPWTSFISFMLGADPVVDFSLANRTLLFDINKESWSDELLTISKLDREKLPETLPAGSIIGQVSHKIAQSMELPAGIPIVLGAHDQCANAVGCGVIHKGQAMLGMGSFICLLPVSTEKLQSHLAIPLGVNTEHHAVPGHFVSFIYNQGGSVVKWFRDTFAEFERQSYEKNGKNIYTKLFSEIPDTPGNMAMLPYFTNNGLPDFYPNTSGVMTGLRLETTRGEILQGIIESIMFDLKKTMDPLAKIGLDVKVIIAVGGGSKSEKWVQISADILGCPIHRPHVSEAGILGAAIIAGVGCESFINYTEAASVMVQSGDTFFPDSVKQAIFQKKYLTHKNLREKLSGFLDDLSHTHEV
jgi:xylulokinase